MRLVCRVQINPRVSPSMVIKSALILSSIGVSFYGTFFGFQSLLVRLYFAQNRQ